MEETLLTHIIHVQKANDREALQKLLDRFRNYIRKYARKLQDDSAEQELMIFLVELIPKIPVSKMCSDGQAVLYITKSIKYEFLRLLKVEKKKHLYEVSLGELVNEYYTTSLSDCERIELRLSLDSLTTFQKEVLIKLYFEDYTIAEIAEKYHVSRRNINQTKNKAIDKLRQSFNE